MCQLLLYHLQITNFSSITTNSDDNKKSKKHTMSMFTIITGRANTAFPVRQLISKQCLISLIGPGAGVGHLLALVPVDPGRQPVARVLARFKTSAGHST